MYFMRPSTDTKITMKTIADDTYFGILDITDPDEPGIVLDAIIYNLNTILIPYLRNTPTWVTVTEPELAENIRHKFLTSITQYSEFLSGKVTHITSTLGLHYC